ncbi:MAG: DNA methyltransferase [Leptolinea sp.]
MYYFKNELLFSNAFLNSIIPTKEDINSAYTLMRSARAWLQQADLSSLDSMTTSLIRPLLQNQSLDLTPVENDPVAYILAAPWDAQKPLGLLYIVPAERMLDGVREDGRIPKGQHWMVKAVDCARSAGLRWVVLTNAKQWRLLDAQGLRRYEAYLEIDLSSLTQSNAASRDYDLAAYLFYFLFNLERGFAADTETGRSGLDQFYAGSLHYTEKTERYLKDAVCDNLDIPGGGDGIIAQLCLGLVHAVDPQSRHVFSDTERNAIYRDATFLLYRLLFILYAEARALLPVDDPAYDDISLHRLVDDALDMHGDPQRAALRPTRLWDALLSLFNRIDVGDIVLGVPAFDGGLFDNTGHPYLSKFSIENTYLADALVQLAFLKSPHLPVGLERIDYCDLSVRHLGSLYEGMIEYRLFIAEEELLARREKDGRVRYLPLKDTPRKMNDELISSGQVYFAQSPHERKSTGTHYTLEDLVERLVRQTVLRLLDERWQSFENDFNGWLRDLEAAPASRRPAMQDFIDARLEEFVKQQILTLRVCDPAMGSGHFLVHTAHQITNFILHSLARTRWENVAVDLNPAIWRQHVVEQCLYGVDINPMAVELAKLSLWLVSMQSGKPLSFLDHHLKQGNSLLGASLEEIEALLENNELNRTTARSAIAETRGQYAFHTLLPVLRSLNKAGSLMEKIASQIITRVEDVHQQALDYADVESILAPYKRVGDLLVARKMGLKISTHGLQLLAKTHEIGDPLPADQQQWQDKVDLMLKDMTSFHWEFEFPEIFWNDEKKGFDIVVGNPPFLGGLKISTEMGDKYANFLQIEFSPTNKNVDLCTYFLRKSFILLNSPGQMGFIATNTISQGDTRSAGLMKIIINEGMIYFAKKFVHWGGDANVEINLLCIGKGGQIKPFLDENEVPFISSWLDDLPEYLPSKLAQNNSKSFVGHYVCGTGFIIEKKEFLSIISSNSKTERYIRPYVIGREINENIEQVPQRYVICFENLTLDEASQYLELITILRERVKPKRDKLKVKSRKEKWWVFAGYYLNLQKVVESIPRVLIRSRVSELNLLTFVPNDMIYSDATIVFAYDDYYHFALLQSWIHEVWLRRQASTMRTDIRYTPTDCFQTFPFPQQPTAEQKVVADSAGKSFYEFRRGIIQQRQLGLTKTYNLFNNPDCQDKDIRQMRALHIQMDLAILACYGWEDIEPQHDFYPNDRKKIRFMPSPPAQREIFMRLIDLNQRIAAEEAAHGISPVVNSEAEEEPIE